MTGYFVRRFLLIAPTFIGVTVLVFALTRLVPGGPIERMLAEAARAGTEAAGTTSGFDGHGASALSEEQLADLWRIAFATPSGTHTPYVSTSVTTP